MRLIKSLLNMSVLIAFIIMIFLGTVYGSSVTTQHEGATQNESTVIKKDVVTDGNELNFAPRKLKDKNDSDAVSEKGGRRVNAQRYKPSDHGEGESKTQ